MARPIKFFKMSGSGNDFIIIDNRQGVISAGQAAAFARKLCSRQMSVGADGLILVELSDQADFKWRFHNSDGSVAEMCGNGARCAARYAYMHGIAGQKMCFETVAGMIRAQVNEDRVKIEMTPPTDFAPSHTVDVAGDALNVAKINTGVPHAAIAVDNVETVDVVNLGRKIRYHGAFSPAGTNANFYSFRPDGVIVNRTYERGVEDETLACGTGCVAVALVSAREKEAVSPVTVIPKSGEALTIHFNVQEDRFSDVFLEGNARIICKGELLEDAWQWGTD